MKVKICLLVLAVCLISTTLAMAATRMVYSTDFVGKITTYYTSTGDFVEARSGKWINEDGGTFEGDAQITKKRDGSYQITKKGKIIGLNIEGALQYDEFKDAAGKVSSNEVITGKERLDDGGTFEGDKAIIRQPDGSYQIRKRGKVIGPNLDGLLQYDEFKDAAGKVSSNEVITGKERLDDGGTFEGDKAIIRQPDGSYQIRKRGKVIGPNLDGLLQYDEFKDVAGKVSSNEVITGKERLDDGGTFEGDKAIIRQPDGSYRIMKRGRIFTATLNNGYLRYDELKDIAGKVSSNEVTYGTWRISPSFILMGYVSVNRTPDGKVVVKDNRMTSPTFIP